MKKLHTVIILLAIALSVVAPPSLPLAISHGGQASIGTLDVCHSATPALSSNGDMPCINERSCSPLPLALENAAENAHTPCIPFIIAYQDERPPKS